MGREACAPNEVLYIESQLPPRIEPRIDTRKKNTRSVMYYSIMYYSIKILETKYLDLEWD